ncbi:MAG: 4-hydroxythreonine-4-phosphate dehydrogenase PdxA [Candidatus Aminicenantes bacterium]|nr:4-hydroxythreonine-4-phosphate dehydrogenase PdxA [Candidatus Aminicenantes bacterium]
MEKAPDGRILLITLGDPDGIGSEIIKKSLESIRLQIPVVLLGNRKYYNDDSIEVLEEIRHSVKEKVSFLEVNTEGNDPSFMYVKEAVSLALNDPKYAIITAPISKEKWIGSGNQFMGHTDYLVKSCDVNKWAMFFWSDSIKVALYTTHIPLRDIFSEIKKEKIMNFCRFINSELFRLTGKKFDLLMSGLNPHSGESGTIGKEEEEEIEPAVKELQKEMNIEGPFPPDTIFIEAEKRKDPVVISLYHDQGLIPFKLNNINSGVNLTLGLPFIRTSPDHGTAYDIAGKGIADPGSMIEAIKLADQLLKVKT